MFLNQQCVVCHSVRAFHLRIYTLHAASILPRCFVTHLFSWCKKCLYLCVWNEMANFRNETNSPNRCQLCPTGSVNGRAWNINNQLPSFLACSVQVKFYKNNNNNNKKNNNNNNHIDIMHNTANHNHFLPIFYSGGVINKDACQVKIYKIQKMEIWTRTELFWNFMKNAFVLLTL